MNFRKIHQSCEIALLSLLLGLGFATSGLRAGQASQAPASPPMQIDMIESRARGTVIATPDPSVKYRLAGGGFVERSADGGATWNGQMVSPNARLIAGSAPSAKVCWIVGRDAAITLTKNGTDWQQVDPPVVTDFVAVTAKNDSTATVTTLGGKKYITTDRGKKWKPVS